jgi:Tfp pilus assembly protein PilV
MQQRGQSLIELLIAMFVIIVGLSASGTIIFSNLRLQERSADRVVGTNLAREGVELAKAVRDSNWVAGGSTAFDVGLYSGTDYTAVPRMDGGTYIDFDFTPNAIADATATLKRSTNASSPGLFVQGTGSTGSNAGFSRLVTLAPICSDHTTRASGLTCGGLTKIGIQITSTVQWTKRGTTFTSTIVDNIYDWR